MQSWKFLWTGIFLLLGLSAYYFFADPETQPHLFLKCPIYEFTGYRCPGCGSQRAFHALLHGRVEDALHKNSLFVLGVPYVLFFALAALRKKHHPRLYTILTSGRMVFFLALAGILFGILRNL